MRRTPVKFSRIKLSKVSKSSDFSNGVMEKKEERERERKK
jgi:hypothetical protein